MKLKDVKKHFKAKIREGWRFYLPIKISYEKLGINPSDYMNIGNIETLLNLKYSGEESGICDEYHMLDYDLMYNGQPLDVIVNFHNGMLFNDEGDDIVKSRIGENTVYLKDGEDYYWIEGMAGYKNPACIYDKENGYPKDQPYWLYKGDENHEFHRWKLVNGPDTDTCMELLRKYKNNRKFASDLHSSDICYSMISGNFGQNIETNIMKELSGLNNFCKTTYSDFKEDYVELTYGIRYKDNVEPFLKDLKKIIKKHKLNL